MTGIEMIQLQPTPRCLEIMRIHDRCVLEKAEKLARASRYADAIDYIFLREAVMLHDYGIIGVHAPDIGCFGDAPYIQHGQIGAAYLRQLDAVRYARHARVCERHIGSGLTAKEIIEGNLPLPHRDLLPETLEEKLITYADNFFSKNPEHLTEEKPLERIQNSLAKFGPAPLERFQILHELWKSEI